MPLASPVEFGSLKLPLLSTGIDVIKNGFANLDEYATGLPGSLIAPKLISCHMGRLSLVYGAGPYRDIHHCGITLNPNISQGHKCGLSVSNIQR